MNQPKNTFLIAAFFIFCFSSVSFAQNPPKPAESSFDVVLQTVVASNDTTSKNDVPPTLSSVVKKMKNDFSFSSYRLTSTFMQKIFNKGSFESKCIAYEGNNQDRNTKAYSEWILGNLENLLDENGQELIKIKGFRFAQSIPVKNSINPSDYEQASLRTEFSLLKNTPTIIGSITPSSSNEMIFLILTVKSVEK